MSDNPYFGNEFDEQPFNGIRKCRVCQKISGLKYCQQCQLECYCSKEHQIQRWKKHKEFCKLVGKLIAVDEANNLHEIVRHRGNMEAGAESLRKAIILLQEMLPRLLNRKLSFDEMMLVMHPNYCCVCFTTDKNKLTDCPRCLNASFCRNNEKCKKKFIEVHDNVCDNLRIQLLIDEHAVGEPLFRNKVPRAGRYDLGSGGIFDLLEFLTGKNFTRSPYTETEQKQFVQVSQFSFTATILYSFYLCKTLDTMQSLLTIHVVGAKHEYNYFNGELSSIIFVFMPNIRCINYVLIGPELHRNNSSMEESFGGKTVKVQMVRNVYENFKSKAAPDVIICYNSGFTEMEYCPENTWIAGVSKILKQKNIPIAFTSYVEYERADDLEFIQRVASEKNIMLGEPIYSGRNPYKDHRPIKGLVAEEQQDSLFYANNFLSLFRLC